MRQRSFASRARVDRGVVTGRLLSQYRVGGFGGCRRSRNSPGAHVIPQGDGERAVGVWPSRSSRVLPRLRRAREPMARRTFDVVDVTEILIHWHAGRSISEVSTSLGVDRKTIRKYLAPAVAAGLTPGGAPMAQAEWAALVLTWFPQLVDTSLRQVTWPEIAGHHDYIVAQLKAGVT